MNKNGREDGGLDPHDLTKPMTLEIKLVVDRDQFLRATNEIDTSKVAEYLGIVTGTAIVKAEIDPDARRKLRELGVLSSVRQI